MPADWSLRGQPPYRVEPAGQVWIIVDSQGINRAAGPHGACLFVTEEHAERVTANARRSS